MKPKPNLLPGVFLFLFLMLVASLAMFLSQQPPGPLPAGIPASEFLVERSFHCLCRGIPGDGAASSRFLFHHWRSAHCPHLRTSVCFRTGPERRLYDE